MAAFGQPSNMLPGFMKTGGAFTRPVQILPTEEEVKQELSERSKQDELDIQHRALLLAEIFPVTFATHLERTKEQIEAQALPVDAFF